MKEEGLFQFMVSEGHHPRSGDSVGCCLIQVDSGNGRLGVKEQ